MIFDRGINSVAEVISAETGQETVTSGGKVILEFSISTASEADAFCWEFSSNVGITASKGGEIPGVA